MVQITSEDESFDTFTSDSDVEPLEDVAQRIKEDNLAVFSVEKVNEERLHNTYVDFKVHGHGIEWSRTDDFGGWELTACEAKDGDVYRVWFQQ